METIIGSQAEQPNSNIWSFTVDERREETSQQADVWFEARLPYRQVAWIGRTEREAIGNMLHGVAQLARDGHIDPEAPDRMGIPPIQHALSVLEKALAWSVESRRSRIEMQNNGTSEPEPLTPLFADPGFSRNAEIISGLATAIAALARVKEL